MEAIITGKSIFFNNTKTCIDDLLNDSLYKFSNKRAADFNNDYYGVNELFVDIVLPYMAIENWILDNHPDVINVKKAEKIYKFIFLDVCCKINIRVKGLGLFEKIVETINYNVWVFASAIYFAYRLLLIPFKPGIVVADKFAVVRSKASIKKFSHFSEINQEVESLYSKSSIYRLFPKPLRIKWVFQSFINSYKSMRSMLCFYTDKLGRNFEYVLRHYYKKRIVYAELYKLMLGAYLSHFINKEFYTGNNLDRFSVIEDQLCAKFNIKSYNIPHGIEYGFKFPKGFSSDVFYTHSQYTAEFLNRLYNTSKYVFDKSIISRMFEYNYNVPHEKMIIFFTEPREVNVNVDIVKDLIPRLKEKGLKLYLKLHPVDKKANYEGIDVEFISDYELSLTGNICISRKSTILLEAIYNNSLPIAIITNPNDNTMFTLFPSLNTKEIIKTYSVQELFNVIMKNI